MRQYYLERFPGGFFAMFEKHRPALYYDKAGRPNAVNCLLADIAAADAGDKITNRAERIFIGKLPVIVIVFQREKIAFVVVHKPLEDLLILVQRKVADLDDKDHARQRISLKFYAIRFEIFDAVRDAVVCDLRVVKHYRPFSVEYIEAKSEIRHYGPVCVLAVDKAKLNLFTDFRRLYRCRVAVDSCDLRHIFRRHGPKFFKHPLGRIIKIRVVKAACVGLLKRAFIERKNMGAFAVKQMRLNAAAEIRTDLKIIVTGPEFPHGNLHGKQRTPVMLGRLAVDLFK